LDALENRAAFGEPNALSKGLKVVYRAGEGAIHIKDPVLEAGKFKQLPPSIRMCWKIQVPSIINMLKIKLFLPMSSKI